MKNINSRVKNDSHPLKRKVKVYDVENKKLIFEFDSLNEASKKLGVKSIDVYIKNKSKSYKNNLGITLCFR